ncbi:hypothetical protein GF378_03225 [Candidatus Pacearchaeota archaeon]|nr:hypothetical protein [Candidatus Pacearchaeota archaeon]
MLKGNLIKKTRKTKKAQVWVNTVVYTLIAFSLIAVVLAFAKPKIEEIQDKAVIEQSISLMRDLDSTIMEIVQGGSGNKRVLETSIKKGELTINSLEDEINFEIESRYVYSEQGTTIQDGNLKIKTEEFGDLNLVRINRDYENYNITFNAKEENKIISKAATPYKISVWNRGKKETGDGEKWHIDVEVS